MTIRNIPAFLALTCLTTLALTACSPGSPEAGRPNTAPPSSTVPTASGSSSTPSMPPSGPPQRPTAAIGLTLSAADAFFRYYVELKNYAATTGDTQPLLAESEAGCEGCKDYADLAARVNAANGGVTGDFREQVKDVYQLVRGSTGRVGAKAVIKVGEYTVKQSPSATPVVSDPAEYTSSIALSASGQNWVMYEMELVER